MDFKPQSSPADSSATDPVVLDGSGKSDPVGRPRKIPFAQIDNDLRRAVAARKVVGIVARAAPAEGIVYEGQFGKRDLSSGQDITSESVFWLRSLTKAITASSCMQLVE